MTLTPANKQAHMLGTVFFFISFICGVIAYGTGYWYEGPGEGRLFKRLGLWEACFDGYEHTSDYVGKKYYGCWWIFHKEYSYIKDWILPAWFVGVQTLMTFAIVLLFAGLVVVPMAGRETETARPQSAAVFVAVGTSLCLGISTLVFGTMVGEDRTWMPRFDINILSWSFGLAVIAAFFAGFASICLTISMLKRKYDLLPRDDEDKPKGMGIEMVPRV